MACVKQGTGCGWNLCLDGGASLTPQFPQAPSGYAQFSSYASTCAARPLAQCDGPLPNSSWVLPATPVPNPNGWADGAINYEIGACNNVLKGVLPSWKAPATTTVVSTTTIATTSTASTTLTTTTTTVKPCYMNFNPGVCMSTFGANSQLSCHNAGASSSVTCSPQYPIDNSGGDLLTFEKICSSRDFITCNSALSGFSKQLTPAECSGKCP